MHAEATGVPRICPMGGLRSCTGGWLFNGIEGIVLRNRTKFCIKRHSTFQHLAIGAEARPGGMGVRGCPPWLKVSETQTCCYDTGYPPIENLHDNCMYLSFCLCHNDYFRFE